MPMIVFIQISFALTWTKKQLFFIKNYFEMSKNAIMCIFDLQTKTMKKIKLCDRICQNTFCSNFF